MVPAMNVRIRRRGPAGKYEMWARCRDPERWPSWLALVRGVRARGLLRPGLEGELVLVGRLRVSFDVLDVDDVGTTWTRLVRLGPFRLRIEQRVDEGFAWILATGAFPLVLAYAPLARRSLSRLLRRGRS